MREIERFVAEHAVRHPELRRQIHWPQVRTIARREGVRVRRLPLSRPGRLVRFGRSWEIQLSDELTPTELAVVGTHELVHYWRDREDESAFYSGEEWEPDSKEDFANLVAWYLTTPHRPPLADAREGSL
jgi:hypothetical protein